MDDLERKLAEIHHQKKDVEKVRVEAHQELIDAQEKIAEIKKRLEEIHGHLEETSLLQEKFLSVTGTEDTVTAEMLQGFKEAKEKLSEKISRYEDLRKSILTSLETAQKLLTDLDKRRSSFLN